MCALKNGIPEIARIQFYQLLVGIDNESTMNSNLIFDNNCKMPMFKQTNLYYFVTLVLTCQLTDCFQHKCCLFLRNELQMYI